MLFYTDNTQCMLLITQKTATIMKKMEKVKKQKRLQKEQSSRKECHDGK